ncbi:hypothetical protein U9M48_015545 [Paspalum notatum var. saurae]|uniref:Uncharacterized protein n=1 Tax=Paspalum notatum var. saurae TaxID=547442 RepID=A0AAQ3T5H6_PASNO
MTLLSSSLIDSSCVGGDVRDHSWFAADGIEFMKDIELPNLLGLSTILKSSVLQRVPVCWINIIKALRKLDKSSVVAITPVQHEAHCSSEGL